MRYKTLGIPLWLVIAALSGHSAGLEFRLHDTRGAVHTPIEWSGHKAVVLFFTTIDCPVANSYVPEMNRIDASYAPRGVLVYAVQADPTIPGPQVAQYANDYRYAFPLLLDPTQILVRLTDAKITPQVAILNPQGQVLYLGRVDNRVVDFGKQRPQATVQDLRVALDAVLAGKPVPEPRTKSIGCAINRVQP